jgi:hypothetical protein
MKTININTQAEVKLTEYGREIFNKYYSKFPDSIKPKAPTILKTELWQLMNIFGDCLYQGNLKLPFENNNINIITVTPVQLKKEENKNTCYSCFEYQAGCVYPKPDRSGCDKYVDPF